VPGFGQRTPVDLDVAVIAAQIKASKAAPKARGASGPDATVTLPWLEDETREFDLYEASQFTPEMQAKYSDIRSYRITNPGTDEVIGRMNVSPSGVFAIALDPAGPIQIGHEFKDNGTIEQFIQRLDLKAAQSNFTCAVENAPFSKTKSSQAQRFVNSCFQLGAQLREYDIALTNTFEFADQNSAGSPTLAEVNTAFNNRIAELNAIYEREVAITFVLAAGNDVLVNLTAADPFTDPDDTGVSLTQAENYIEANLSNNAYDIGHGLHSVQLPSGGGGVSFGGLAGVGVVCQTGSKARGYSTVLDDAALVILAHEVGHQFNCNHTNYGCTNTGADRFEPGEGVTIMGTGADCGAADTYGGDIGDFFHAGSISTIVDYIASTGSCFTTTGTTITEPSSDAAQPTGTVLTIPTGTPFYLQGSGNGGVGALTYSWESIDTDLGTSEPPTSTATNTTAPLFRSFAPSAGTDRYFPSLQNVIAGNTNGQFGETLPSVARDINLRLTVRAGGRGIACDLVTVQVINTGSPFDVTSQATPTTWAPTSSQTVTWDPAGTDGGTINVGQVDIFFSADGGTSFPIQLATGVANDGSQAITAPNVTTGEGRVLVRASGGIFYDVNGADIAISSASVCNAAQVPIAPATAVSAPQGDPTLNLSLSPQFGNALTSPILIGINSSSNTSDVFAEDANNPGSCASFNSGNFYELREVYVSTAGTVSFTSTSQGGSSGTFIPTATVFTPSFQETCDGFVGSTRRLSGNTLIGQTFSESLQPNTPYALVGFAGGTGATGTVRVDISSGTLLDGPADPGAGFSYTYAIVDNTGSIVDFDLNSDLSDGSTYPTGQYTVFGVSVENGTNLATFEGGQFTTFEQAALTNTICAAVSTNSVAVTVEAALPVELTSLTATSTTEGNIIEWSTASEVDASHFDVETREASGAWVTIGSSAATSPSGGDYAFVHASAPSGISYYRLNAVDLDGSTELSDIVSTTRESSAAQFALYPNPTGQSTVSLQVSGQSLPDQLRIVVSDAAGRKILEQLVLENESERIPVTLPSRAGLYFVSVYSQTTGALLSTLRSTRTN